MRITVIAPPGARSTARLRWAKAVLDDLARGVQAAGHDLRSTPPGC